jgi:hypothetical protein
MAAFRRSDRPNASMLTLHRPEPEPRERPRPPGEPRARDVVYWRVNGYRAAMLVWTDAEFELLPARERPGDAQHFSCGIWAVLRMV